MRWLDRKRSGGFLFLSLFLYLLLSACAGLNSPLPTATLPVPPSATPNTPDPAGTPATFLHPRHPGDYNGMYSLLSPLSQAATSLADFTQRYQDVARTAGVKSVQASVLSVLKNGDTAQVSYEVDLHTAVVGTISRKNSMPLVYGE